MKIALIIQAQMKQYRLPLFEQLHAALKSDDVELRVAYSDPLPQELGKKDNTELTAEYGVKVPAYWLLGNRILYQPLAREIARADLVIVEQANKYLWNHLLLLLATFGRKRFAFWGHGQNKQADRSGPSEWYKRRILKCADWWFAYTEVTARFLAASGVDPRRITNLNNAVDTSEIRRLCNSFPPEELEAARRDFGIAPGAPVGIYCGMLDRVKALDFVIASARLVRQARSDFHLILVGGGPDQRAVHAAIRGTDWIHYVGPKFGCHKALLLKLSDVLLNPGRVGLVILDAFAAGLPLVTTELAIHCPEIEYLEVGHNGLITAPVEQEYASAVVKVLTDTSRLHELKAGALRSGEKYTLEKMVERFKDGIIQCLEMEPRMLIFAQARKS